MEISETTFLRKSGRILHALWVGRFMESARRTYFGLRSIVENGNNFRKFEHRITTIKVLHFLLYLDL